MSAFVAAVLIMYCVLLGRGADRFLSRSAWCREHPHQALRLWQACGIGTLSALAGAGLVVAHDIWEHLVVWLFHADKRSVHHLYAAHESVSPWWNTTAAIIALLIAGIVLDAVRRSIATARIRARHRLLVRVCGRPTGEPDLYLLDVPEVAAYCVPGPRRSGRVIVTSASRELLTDEEMTATVEHERAHLDQRHHAKILVAETVTRLLAPLGLLRNYATQIHQLTEMAADDRAAKRCGAETVARALLRIGSAGGPAPGASPFLAMAGSLTAERIRRLLQPRRRAVRYPSIIVTCVVMAFGLVPFGLVVGPAASLAGTHHCAAACRN
ncbi:Zn-dependent protease with chaperone function [Kribbella sp. VKM Ac-2527]|uniref:Zn-dependent protease with chaperone function n=1 Tax=Kribbella caucasensis TaxID=2512215 RepID=A0A4R6KG86_9ACTN|nr:M56 family metallopeptidase [Kribbella sp. VKM Ac-2527]TDO48459.1 Zn-dependent protease with chaperone function [Kribbella sp. VKM Ac-2527]